MTVTSETPARQRGPEETARPARFVEGYLNDRFAAGHRPTYGYPKTRLPDAAGREMEVVTCFVGARRAG